MAAFDPYHQWLGIPATEQPPNHYRLLSVPLWEPDLDVIEAAAERQTVFLRTFQLGPQSELAERILNEVARARVTLLNVDQKVAYDDQLRESLPAATGFSASSNTEVLTAEIDRLREQQQNLEQQLRQEQESFQQLTARQTEEQETIERELEQRQAELDDQSLALQERQEKEALRWRTLVGQLEKERGDLQARREQQEKLRQDLMDQEQELEQETRRLEQERAKLEKRQQQLEREVTDREQDQGQQHTTETDQSQTATSDEKLVSRQSVFSRIPRWVLVTVGSLLASWVLVLVASVLMRQGFEPPESPVADLKNGLVAYYPFNGNAKDESGSGNHGTIKGATFANDRHGNGNRACRFDGVDDFVDLNDVNVAAHGNSPRSIFAWVKTQQTVDAAVFCSGTPSHKSTFNLFNSNHPGIVGVMGYKNDFYPREGRKYNDNKWHLIGAVYRNDDLETYVDANIDNTSNISFETSGQINYIGRKHAQRAGESSFERFYHGLIDDVRIYNRALSAAEVKTLYELEKPKFEEIVYLDDLQEVSYSVRRAFSLGKHGAGGYNTKEDVVFRGVKPKHCLSMHAQKPSQSGVTHVRYALTERFDRFQATVGFSTSTAPPAVPAVFRVVGNGRIIWSSRPLTRNSDSQDVDISISGIKDLKLVVDRVRNEASLLTIWVNPRIVRKVPARVVTPIGRQRKPTTPAPPKMSRAQRALAAPFLDLMTPAQKDLGGPIVNSIDIVLVPIPAGEFLMGSPESEVGRSDRETQHKVQITKPFYLSAYEVTQAQYQEVMNDNLSASKGPAKPVENVSWGDARDFCQMLNEKEGVEYRLPTEAEWEYACRAGTTTAYSFGDDVSRLGDYAWWGDNSNGSTHPVGGLKPNAWGLFDMHGNVWEWCQDWYGNYETERMLLDPTGPESGSWRVLRGGAFVDRAGLVRAADRSDNEPNYPCHVSGFRLARTYPLSP